VFTISRQLTLDVILYKTLKILSHTDHNINVRCMLYCQYIATVMPPTYVITWPPRNTTFMPTSAEVVDRYFAHLSAYLPIRLPQNVFCGPGSSVGIATCYGLDGPANESQRRRDFPDLSIPAPGPTQPPVQWVPGLSRG
jgi:hypothetical protein